MGIIKQIRKQQVQLAYHGVLTWMESEHMAVIEREEAFNNLVEIKRQEEEEKLRARKKK